MSIYDDYPDPDYDPGFEEEEFPSCDYGAEFCEHPDIRSMNLCTTECPLYFEMVRQNQEASP
jgi:hypothetical protein